MSPDIDQSVPAVVFKEAQAKEDPDYLQGGASKGATDSTLYFPKKARISMESTKKLPQISSHRKPPQILLTSQRKKESYPYRTTSAYRCISL